MNMSWSDYEDNILVDSLLTGILIESTCLIHQRSENITQNRIMEYAINFVY